MNQPRHFAYRFITMLLAIALTASVMLFSPGISATAGTDVTCFRILHASPDAPNIDVYVTNTPIAKNLAYTKFTKNWHLATTAVRVRVYATPGDPNAGAYRDVTLQLQFGQCYVIVIGNNFQNLEIFTLQDPPVPPAGQFTLRLANLAPGSPALDLTKNDGTPLIGNVPFKSATPSNYPPGKYALQIKQTGTGALLLDLGTHTFRSRTRQTVYVFAVGGTQPTARSAQAQSAPQFVIAP